MLSQKKKNKKNISKQTQIKISTLPASDTIKRGEAGGARCSCMCVSVMRARNRKRKRSKNESRSIQDNDNTLARASYESTAVSAFRMCECDGSQTMNDQQKLQGTEPRRILFGYRIRAHMHTHSHLHICIYMYQHIHSICVFLWICKYTVWKAQKY